MTLPSSLLSEDEALQIKERLWAGHQTQSAIAKDFGVSQPTISRIYRGTDFKQLPWPDGSLGGITNERRKVIHVSRNRKTRYQHDSRDGNTELAPSESADISAAVNGVLIAEDSELRALLSTGASLTSGKAIKEGGSSPNGMLPYPDIKLADPGHPIVTELETKDDPPLKIALRIVCATIEPTRWQHPEVIKAIHAEADKIRISLGR